MNSFCDNKYQDIYNKNQIVTLRVMFGIGIILFSINIALAIHNIDQYLVRKRIAGNLVTFFYIIVIVINTAQLIQYIIFLIKPQYDIYRHHLASEKPFIAVLDWVIMISMFAIGTIMLVNMYQLSISIRQFLSLLTLNESKRLK